VVDQDHRAICKALSDDEVAALRLAPRKVSMDDVCKVAKLVDPSERVEIVEALKSGEAKSFKAAEKLNKAASKKPATDPVEDALKQLSTAWERAPMAAKRRFVEDHFDDIEAAGFTLAQGETKT
jgi:ParB family transcriptional regulator, chromosome partitioning protein